MSEALSAEVPASPSGETLSAPSAAYHRRRPEETVLYQCVEENHQSFAALYEEQDRVLPAFVRREFEMYLECGQLCYGFARIRCGDGGDDRFTAAVEASRLRLRPILMTALAFILGVTPMACSHGPGFEMRPTM